jgi:hypothetical protein
MTGIARSVTIKLGRQLSFFDCLHPIFSLSAYVKVSLAGEEFANRLTNERVVIHD